MKLSEKMQAGSLKPEEMREEAPKVFAGMRDQLAGVLSRDQQEKLRDAIQSRVDRVPGNGNSQNKPDAKGEAPTPEMKTDLKMEPNEGSGFGVGGSENQGSGFRVQGSEKAASATPSPPEPRTP